MIEHAKNELEIINHPQKEEILNILKKINEQGYNKTGIYFLKNAIKNNDFIADKILEINGLFQSNLNELKLFVEKLNNKDKEILLKLIDCRNLSNLELDNNQWIKEWCGYKHKRLPFLHKFLENDKPRYINSVICKNKDKTCFISREVYVEENQKKYLLRGLLPKSFTTDSFPTIYINVTEEEDNIYTTEEELNKVRKFYDLEEGE